MRTHVKILTCIRGNIGKKIGRPLYPLNQFIKIYKTLTIRYQ